MDQTDIPRARNHHELSRDEIFLHATDEERIRLERYADSLSCGRRTRALLARIRARMQT